jgi:hypothetical protein
MTLAAALGQAAPPTLLEAAIGRLDDAAMRVIALQNIYPDIAEMHTILADLAPAFDLLHVLRQLGPGAVDGLIAQALAVAAADRARRQQQEVPR